MLLAEAAALYPTRSGGFAFGGQSVKVAEQATEVTGRFLGDA